VVYGEVSSLLAVVFFATTAAEPGTVEQRVADFTLHDYRGAERRLSEWRQNKAIVIAFLGNECPLARKYGPRLAELARTYEPKGVAFIGINSNTQDSPTEIGHYVRDVGIQFPVLKDPGHVVADQFGAERTPEVFVLDSTGVVRYRGRIDDQYGVGYQRPNPTRRYLAAALDAILAGERVIEPLVEAEGCIIGRAHRQIRSTEITYSKTIAPILNRRCVVCHREGDIGPFSLTSYDDASAWSGMIREVVRSRRMPPWHADPRYGRFANDARLSDEEVQAILRWVENGAPQGDPNDAPPASAFVDGWRIGKPDRIIVMPRPYWVPAEGEVKYQYFRVDPAFTEDQWVRAAECRPGNRAVVHHMLVFVQPPFADRLGQRQAPIGGWLAGFAPGSRPMVLGDGMAKRIPKGAKLIFQMHYTPNGSPQQDRSSVGLVLAQPDSIKYQVTTRRAANVRFEIPPHAEDYRIEATTRLGQDGLLLAMFPHMHLRGKSFRYEAIFPDGRREILLEVPRYDFGWQNSYVLAQPRQIPKGTRMHCVACYDNSSKNRSNPDPSAAVRWGDQTWEEMMIGYFDVATPVVGEVPPAEPHSAE
jgi:peroxiredoxin